MEPPVGLCSVDALGIVGDVAPVEEHNLVIAGFDGVDGHKGLGVDDA